MAEAEERASPAEIDDILTVMLRLIDFSQDLERNQRDALFRDDAGKIVYVFDENIFELFFQPAIQKHLITSAYSAHWQTGTSRYERGHVPVEAQSALIASEYLLSETLPGAEGPLIYMTGWHRRELLSRIESIIDALREKARSFKENTTVEFLAMLQLYVSGKDNVDYPENLTKDDWLNQDMDKLRAGNMNEDGLRRYRLARISARMLAASKISEPLGQLKRAMSQPIQARLRTFHLDFCPTPGESDKIRSDAEDWFDRLLEEQKITTLPGIKRARGSLWNDAQSLALIRWAATRHAQPKRKIVLITGDILVFNTYRRWYVETKPESAEHYEPFILRRASQYIPMMNLSDAHNDLSSRDAEIHKRVANLFEKIHGAIEALSWRSTFHDWARPRASADPDLKGRRKSQDFGTLLYPAAGNIWR